MKKENEDIWMKQWMIIGMINDIIDSMLNNK